MSHRCLALVAAVSSLFAAGCGESRVEAPVDPVAVLGDIHGNFQALSAVLEDARKQGAKRLYCVGDITGGGASPNECIDLLRSAGAQCILGDHDAAVVGRLPLDQFSVDDQRAVTWTQTALTSSSRSYLTSLPLELEIDGKHRLFHGTPGSITEELLTTDRAGLILKEAERNWPTVTLLWFGHTHKSLYIGPKAELLEETKETKRLRLQGGRRYLLNPGSAGQSKDRDWRASYALYSEVSRVLQFRRIEYDVASSQKLILRVGLPPSLALRLQFGM